MVYQGLQINPIRVYPGRTCSTLQASQSQLPFKNKIGAACNWLFIDFKSSKVYGLSIDLSAQYQYWLIRIISKMKINGMAGMYT